jgi:hypothetical protein
LALADRPRRIVRETWNSFGDSSLDLANLHDSGLGDHTIRANGIYTEADPERLATLLHCLARPPKEIPYFCRDGGLVFQYHDLDGNPIDFVRGRPRSPRRRKDRNGKDKDAHNKYESTWGSECHAYIPAECRAGLKGGICPVVVTEGEKKALALVQLGYCAVAVGGVNCGLKKDGTLVDELAAIPWSGRLAYVTYDYDKKPRTRRQSLMAASKLAAALKKVGAREVFLVQLPPGPDGAKQGVDDYLKALPLPARRPALDKLLAQAGPVPDCVAWTLRNFREVTVKDGKNKDGKDKFRTERVGLTVREIYDALLAETGAWPRRVGRLLFVTTDDDYEVEWLEKPSQTYAWIGGQLPNTLHWADGIDKVTKGEFDAYLRQSADSYDAVESYPHYPLLDGHFYLHPEPAGGDGKALAGLLDFFRPDTDLDRSLLLAGFLTPLWGGLPGDRPAFLIESAGAAEEEEEEATAGSAAADEDDEDDQGGGAGHGTGKSTVAKGVSYVVGGHISISAREDYNKVKTRLLSPGALTQRIALLDNVKTLKFSWADLEGLITDDVISGHQMYQGEGRRPNTLTWFITLNNASLSKDMAQRCVIVHVRKPRYSATWTKQVRNYIDANRWAVVGDLLALLRGDKPKLARYSRWGAWEQEVLACVPNPEECQAEIGRRQKEVDGDQEESDLIRDAFVRELQSRRHDPATEVVFIANDDAAAIVNAALGDRDQRGTQSASRYLGTLAVRELRKVKRSDLGGRGWLWRGQQAGSNGQPVALNPPGLQQDGVDLITSLKGHKGS